MSSVVFDPCPSAAADVRPPAHTPRRMPGLQRRATGQAHLRRPAAELHPLLRALRPGTGPAHDHPGRGHAPGGQLGRHQGHPEARPLATVRQAQAQAPETHRHRRDRHRRDRRRQGPPLPDGGAGPGQRGGGVRRRRQRGRCPEAVLEAAARLARPRSRRWPPTCRRPTGVRSRPTCRRRRSCSTASTWSSCSTTSSRTSAGSCTARRPTCCRRRSSKGTRWLLLKNPENLDEKKDEKRRLEEALALNKPLATAYYMKEDLRRFWEQPGKRLATAFLNDWIREPWPRGSGCCRSSPRRWRHTAPGCWRTTTADHHRADGRDQQQDQDDEAASLWLPRSGILQAQDPGDPRDEIRARWVEIDSPPYIT